MLIVTYSSIETFRTCHYKYFWEYDQCIKPVSRSWSLIDGDVIHKGLEWLYTPRGAQNSSYTPNKRKKWPSLEGFKTKIEEFYEEKRDYEELPDHQHLVESILEAYTVAYQPDEFEKYNAEVKGQVIVHNPYIDERKFILAFKADALVRKNDKLYIFETKTTSANNMEQFLDNLRLDDQSSTYLYGFRRLGYPAIGVIYNIIRKPKFRQNRFESEDKYWERIKTALLKDASLPAEKRTYFFRETIYRTPAELSEYEEELRRITSDMSAYMVYKSPKRCSFMYGEKCPFRPKCEGNDVEDMFVKKTAQHEELE